MLLMTLTDNTPVSLWSSGEMPSPNFPGKVFTAMIVGEKGLIDLDAYGELRTNVSGEWKTISTQAPVDWAGKGYLDPVRLESYTHHCETFFTSILEGTTPPITGFDGRQAVAAALAAYESSKTGKVIKL